jgi:hypothetical protein
MNPGKPASGSIDRETEVVKTPVHGQSTASPRPSLNAGIRDFVEIVK